MIYYGASAGAREEPFEPALPICATEVRMSDRTSVHTHWVSVPRARRPLAGGDCEQQIAVRASTQDERARLPGSPTACPPR